MCSIIQATDRGESKYTTFTNNISFMHSSFSWRHDFYVVSSGGRASMGSRADASTTSTQRAALDCFLPDSYSSKRGGFQLLL